MPTHKPTLTLLGLALATLAATTAEAQIVSNPIQSSEAYMTSVLDRGQTPVISVNVSPQTYGKLQLTLDPYHPMNSSKGWEYLTAAGSIDATVLCPVSGHCGARNRQQWRNGNVSTLTFNGKVIARVTHRGEDIVRIPVKLDLEVGKNELIFSQRDPRTGRGTHPRGFVPGRNVTITRVATQNSRLARRPARRALGRAR